MSKIYLIRSYNDDCGELIVGYATTEEKAIKMKEYLENIFNSEWDEDEEEFIQCFEYEIIPVETDMLFVDDEDINF